MHLLLSELESPIGTVLLVSDGTALRALDFSEHEDRMRTLLQRQYGAHRLVPSPQPDPAASAVQAYFAGDLAALDSIRTQTAGTLFQRLVWRALRDVPAGATTTYGRLAERIGRAGAQRAVGLANGANPLALVVPCHRVIGANATLTGYGGGLHRKEWLIAHERRYAQRAAGA